MAWFCRHSVVICDDNDEMELATRIQFLRKSSGFAVEMHPVVVGLFWNFWPLELGRLGCPQ